MNPANLPFDSEAMLQGLRGWVECESPTFDAAAVERMLDLAAREMAIMGASGSGKSTCMNVLGALDTPTAGKYLFRGVDVGDRVTECHGLRELHAKFSTHSHGAIGRRQCG